MSDNVVIIRFVVVFTVEAGPVVITELTVVELS